MPIQFKSKLSSSVANATFLDKTIDDIKKGKLTLYKINIGDAETIDDVQNYINELAIISGVNGEGDALSTTYSSEEIIDNGDDRKVAIGKIDAQVNTNINNILANTALIESGEILIKAYANDAAYETDNGAVPYSNKTAIYYNSTTGLIRYYDDVGASWEDVGTSAIGEHESLGNGDGFTVDFSLSSLPLTENSFIVFRNGLKVDRSEYTFSTPTITFNTAPFAGQSIDVWMMTDGTPSLTTITSGTQIVEYKTLDATDISNKLITIPTTPSDVSKVILDVIKGSSQQYGVDFNVSGTTLNWNGLGLDGELNIGDVLRYHYFA